MNLVCVPPAQAGQAWALVGHMIAEAMRRGSGSDVAAVHDDVMAGRSLLWVALDGGAIEAAAVTELIEIGGRRVCAIVACGGRDPARWLHLIEGLEDYARREGCAATRLSGRAGWRRLLPTYRVAEVTLERAL